MERENEMMMALLGELSESLAPEPVKDADGAYWDLGSGVRLYPVEFRGLRVFVTIPED